MGLLSIVNHFFIYMPTLMLTRLEIKMILLLPAHSLYTLVTVQFLGVLRNDPQLLVPPLKPNIDLSLPPLLPLLTFVRFLIYLVSSICSLLRNKLSTVTISVRPTNPVFHSRMKHVALDYHFICEQVQNDNLHVTHVASADQLADALTKPLPRICFHQLLLKIGLSSRSSNLLGHFGESVQIGLNLNYVITNM